jgi:hypothetical protein
MGHEAWNFLPVRGKVYGYIPRLTTVRDALGASPNDAVLEGVTGVWLSGHISTGQTVIVGWYKNSVVHRRAGALRIRREGREVMPQVVADEGDARLLPIDQRTFAIPTKKEPGCLGRSPVWYGRNELFRTKVREFIQRDGRYVPLCKKASLRAGFNGDPAARKKMEVAAVEYATRYYQSIAGGERRVVSVERDALGWDLNAFGSNDCLKVEVKGFSGDVCSVELTPNEYKAMLSAEHRKNYVVFIVAGLGGTRPYAHIFRYDNESSSVDHPVWVSQRGQRLHIWPRMAATLSLEM